MTVVSNSSTNSVPVPKDVVKVNPTESTTSPFKWYLHIVLPVLSVLILMLITVVLYLVVTNRRMKRSNHSALDEEKTQAQLKAIPDVGSGAFFNTESRTYAPTLKNKQYTAAFKETNLVSKVAVSRGSNTNGNKPLKLDQGANKPSVLHSNANTSDQQEENKTQYDKKTGKGGMEEKGDGTVVSMCDRDSTLATQPQINTAQSRFDTNDHQQKPNTQQPPEEKTAWPKSLFSRLFGNKKGEEEKKAGKRAKGEGTVVSMCDRDLTPATVAEPVATGYTSPGGIMSVQSTFSTMSPSKSPCTSR